MSESEQVMGSKVKKTRSLKTTRQQYAIYLAELENNKLFRENAFNPKEDYKLIASIWDKLATKLNASGGGPIKDVIGWKKVSYQSNYLYLPKKLFHVSLCRCTYTTIYLTVFRYSLTGRPRQERKPV